MTPDIVEYDGKALRKLAFHLIIDTDTMNELGIILDFKEQIITNDEIKLPMGNNTDLPASNKEALSYQNCLANNEPRSTELDTQCVVKILDAVKTNCSHLSFKEKTKLQEVLTEFEDLFDGTLGG